MLQIDVARLRVGECETRKWTETFERTKPGFCLIAPFNLEDLGGGEGAAPDFESYFCREPGEAVEGLNCGWLCNGFVDLHWEGHP